MSLLCLVDFSKPSKKALGYAANMAEKLEEGLHVLHVFHSPILGYPPTMDAPVLAVPASTKQDAAALLEEWLAPFRERNIEVTGSVVAGAPVQRVVADVAQELGSNLIVMGTHGISGVQRLLLGSITDKVIRTSSIPVLAVPV